MKILALCAVDIMAWKAFGPWLHQLVKEGCEVHIGCARGEYFDRLSAQGFHMHDLPFRRRLLTWSHVSALYQTWRLVRRERFDLVSTHSPIAAAIGRLAATLAGTRVVVYIVHGLYFHDGMHPFLRWLCISVERLFGKLTDYFIFVSEDDRQTAIGTRIVSRAERSVTVFSGVDLERFAPAGSPGERAELKRRLGIPGDISVVAIVGRIVREKGHREFVRMADRVRRGRRVLFLVVGDSLPSDRDQFAPELKNEVAACGLQEAFVFTGMTDAVADYLKVTDVFVLPSYREGFPLSIIEAMSAGLPVVASNITGSREAVVPGETGLLVPSGDADALAEAVQRLLDDPELARRMGEAGRRRAVDRYDGRVIALNFARFLHAAAEGRPLSGPA